MAADPRKWAEDVMVVYDHLRESIPDGLQTPARLELYEWALTNKREFFKNFVPKASDILIKLTKPDDDAEIIRSERKSIAEMKVKLKEYIAEAESAPLV